ncbi:MAG TPA: glycerate kinase [Streptosporangiaceae bacterium]|nr:glycerate kinase [Streptosporangiaceae bacterium]
MRTRVVVAPDKFKGSATAAEVAAALSAGLRRGRPELDVLELPVADGGDGTVAAALAAGFAPVAVTAAGPTGEPVETTFALKDGTAVVELADAAGLRRLPGGFAPLIASTYGVGQVIAAALDHGARRIVLGVGGSASTDGGAGMVQALGARLADQDGVALERGGAALCRIAAVDLAGLDRRLRGAAVLVASDVDNPLLGPSGAAAVFGPQKGASRDDVALLERGLVRWAWLTRAATGREVAAEPGAGAAGGTGFAALAYLDARLVPGIDLVLDLVGFDSAVAGADLVVTGEGCLDTQSLGGKAPVGVARAAARHGVPVVAVAGSVLLTREELAAAGFAAAYSLARIEPDLARGIARVSELLDQVGRQIAASALVA